VNPANDRHGELENETAAIAQLFAAQELHMRNLAKDLVAKGEVFEPPLVFPSGEKYIVADGNRRTTCLKLLAAPRRAPTVELQQFFAECRKNWQGAFPDKIECRVESDRDRVDDILFRRHTGVQGGIGQSTWNDRMKANFVIRTGKGSGLNVADEIEKLLKQAKLLPARRIPRSNLNRLLSAESLRNRLGISVRKGKLDIIRDEAETLAALQRVATDLANRVITLDNIWDTESKLAYIDALEDENVLPKVARKPQPKPLDAFAADRPQSPAPPRPPAWPHLIPDVNYGFTWSAHLQRHRAIWEELQYKLELSEEPNAISVLLRVLLELAIDNYVKRAQPAGVQEADKLSRKATKVAADLYDKGKIDKKYLGAINKLQQGEEIVSIDTLNRYVHSPNFSVSPAHLKMLWETLADFVVHCLKA
jgi:polyhydroxyalkanoate synthesis regulator phasin